MRDAHEHLQQLAAEGRARAGAAAAKSVPRWRRFRRTPPTPQVREERRVREYLVSRGSFDLIGVSLAVLAPMAIAFALALTWDDDVLASQFVAAIFGLIGGGCLFAVRWLVSLGAIARENARLEALGFTLDGWFDVMRLALPQNGRQRIDLKFRAAAPPAERLAAMMTRVAAERDGQPNRFKSPFLLAKKHAGQPASAGRFVYFQWRLLHDVLIPLHREFPLSTVTLRRWADDV